MTLQTRLIALVTLIITLTSTFLGVFAVQRVNQIAIKELDVNLNNIVDQVASSTEDEFAVATFLWDQNEKKFSITYLTVDEDLTTIAESQANLTNKPTSIQLIQAVKAPITLEQNGGLRIRALELTEGEYILFSYSLAGVRENSKLLVQQLVIFSFSLLLIMVLFSYIVFRKDIKLKNLVNSLTHSQFAMRRFLEDASHELKTPLTVIKGYFQLLTKRKVDQLPQVNEYLKTISVEIERMEKIINDLLLITELDGSSDDPKVEINISDLVNFQINKLKDLSPLRPVQSEIDNNLTIFADEENLNRLFYNLFSNILRHTPKDSSVYISLKRVHDLIIFTLEDSGPGLPAQAYEQGIGVFERFDKSRSRETGGSGLGFAIINKIIDHMHSKIELSPGKSGGLKVVVKIPQSKIEK